MAGGHIVKFYFICSNIVFMSSEPIQNIEIKNPSHDDIETIGSSVSKKVDINVLLNRVRQEKLKQKKESLVFFGVVGLVITATGLIASL